MQDEGAAPVTFNKAMDVYALGMVCKCDADVRLLFADLFILDYACMYIIPVCSVGGITYRTHQETISGKIPYYQFQYEMAVFNALANKRPPQRPLELSTPDDQSTSMWDLLRMCWDHDPAARPNASSVVASVSFSGFQELLSLYSNCSAPV